MFRQRSGVPEHPFEPQVAETPAGIRYRMFENMTTAEDDLFIQNDLGGRGFKIDGKALKQRAILKFMDCDGVELCSIRERLNRVRDAIAIEGPDGQWVAIVQRAMSTPLRDHFVVRIGDGPELEVQGNVIGHEYRIGNVATVSRRWFRVEHTYGVEIVADQNDILLLAATVCIDQLTSDLR